MKAHSMKDPACGTLMRGRRWQALEFYAAARRISRLSATAMSSTDAGHPPNCLRGQVSRRGHE